MTAREARDLYTDHVQRHEDSIDINDKLTEIEGEITKACVERLTHINFHIYHMEKEKMDKLQKCLMARGFIVALTTCNRSSTPNIIFHNLQIAW